jgi:hypothetical protein
MSEWGPTFVLSSGIQTDTEIPTDVRIETEEDVHDVDADAEANNLPEGHANVEAVAEYVDEASAQSPNVLDVADTIAEADAQVIYFNGASRVDLRISVIIYLY